MHELSSEAKRETDHGRDHRCAGEGAAREDRRRHDGLQEGAGRDRGRYRGRGRLAAQEGPGRRREEGRPRRRRRPGRRRHRGHASARVVEVNAETDFVARNEPFQDFVRSVAELALGARRRRRGAEGAAVPGHRPHGRRGADPPDRHHRREHEAAPRQRSSRSSRAVVAAYMHNALAPGLGKIGVLVALESDWRPDKLAALGRADRHACGGGQPAISSTSASVDAAALERERGVLREQAAASRQARRDHREDGRGPAAASSTKRSCCWSRSMSSTARAGSSR